MFPAADLGVLHTALLFWARAGTAGRARFDQAGGQGHAGQVGSRCGLRPPAPGVPERLPGPA
jgi:hypothetical protein